MPDYFWEWYKSKGYEKVLDIESCFRNKAFLIGCCIEYLTEKEQKIAKLHEYNNIKDITTYLVTGVALTS